MATTEQMLIHVDTNKSKASEIMPAVAEILGEIWVYHQQLPSPKQQGRVMHIQTKKYRGFNILYKIKESGRVKNIGISNFNHNLVKDCISLGYNDIFCNQVEYHPYLNQKKLISIINKSGILPVAYSPLAKGELLQEKLIIDISNKYSKTPAQIILRWLNQQNWVAIPKSSNKKRLIENLNIFDFTIDKNDMNSLYKLDKNYRVVPSALGTFHQIDLPSKHTNKGLEPI